MVWAHPFLLPPPRPFDPSRPKEVRPGWGASFVPIIPLKELCERVVPQPRSLRPCGSPEGVEDMAWLGGHNKEWRVCVPDRKLPFKQPERRPLGPRRSHAAAQTEALCPSVRPPPGLGEYGAQGLLSTPRGGLGRPAGSAQHSCLDAKSLPSPLLWLFSTNTGALAACPCRYPLCLHGGQGARRPDKGADGPQAPPPQGDPSRSSMGRVQRGNRSGLEAQSPAHRIPFRALRPSRLPNAFGVPAGNSAGCRKLATCGNRNTWGRLGINKVYH